MDDCRGIVRGFPVDRFPWHRSSIHRASDYWRAGRCAEPRKSSDILHSHRVVISLDRPRSGDSHLDCHAHAFAQTNENIVTNSRILRDWVPLFFWMGLIFFMSTDTGSATHTSRILEPLLRWLNPNISPAKIEQFHFVVRKCGHLGEYAVLAILCWRALMHFRSAQSCRSALKNAAIAWVICAGYAASDEFHQSFFSSRGASVRDVLIDSCGALIGLTVLMIIRSRRIRLAHQG